MPLDLKGDFSQTVEILRLIHLFDLTSGEIDFEDLLCVVHHHISFGYDLNKTLEFYAGEGTTNFLSQKINHEPFDFDKFVRDYGKKGEIDPMLSYADQIFKSGMKNASNVESQTSSDLDHTL